MAKLIGVAQVYEAALAEAYAAAETTGRLGDPLAPQQYGPPKIRGGRMHPPINLVGWLTRLGNEACGVKLERDPNLWPQKAQQVSK